MIARNCTIEDLRAALVAVNTRYAGNIRFKTLEQKGRRISFTITVVDSKGPGHSRGRHGRIAAACWHAHGHFFESLFAVNKMAEVYSSGSLANPQTGGWITVKGGNWQDWNKGSIMYPMMASQSCDCGREAQASMERLIQSPLAFRTLSSGQIRNCPIASFDPDHYKADGTCQCLDQIYQEKLKIERKARTDKLLKAQGR